MNENREFITSDSSKEAQLDEFVKLSFFVEIGKAIVSARGINDIFMQVMEKVGSIFAPVNWSLLLVDSKTAELVFKVVVGEAADKLKGVRIPIDKGLSGWVANTGQSVIVEDVSKDSRFNDSIDAISGFKTESLIGVPLKTENKVIGVIELINKLNGGAFTRLELKTLSTIADFAAIAIEREFYIRAIKRLSRTDPLTGVLNRRSMDTVIKREAERCKRYKSKLSVLMIDIDNFKRINDAHGHAKGDEVLNRCARILARNIRKVDYIARYGGDEFAIIMPDTGRREAEAARQRIQSDLKKSNKEAAEIPFQISIGLDTSGAEGIKDLIKASDIDLYRQKERKSPVDIKEYLLDFIDEEEMENQKDR